MATFIGPRPPRDGNDWDAQCARCGSTLAFNHCGVCDGEGVEGHECGEDSCCCAYPEDNLPCGACGGAGVFPDCLSSAGWCASNPMPGRENVSGSTPEWFVVGASPTAAPDTTREPRDVTVGGDAGDGSGG